MDDIVLVDDDDMRRAAQWLWFELGVAAELAGAATTAALQTAKIATTEGQHICAIVSGAGDAGIQN